MAELINVEVQRTDQKAKSDTRIYWLLRVLKFYGFYFPFFRTFLKKQILKEEGLKFKGEQKDFPKVGKDAWRNIDGTNTFRFGTDLIGQPVFSDQMNQHVLIIGSTGSGKSVFLLQLLKQVIAKGGGSTFIDGKADLKLMKQVMAIAYEENREDDILILNFNTEENSDGKQVKSNTFNILTSGEPDEIYETLKSIALPADGDFFVKQAAGVLKAGIVGLFYDRDVLGKTVTMKNLSDRLTLNGFRVQMVPPEDPTLPIELQRPDPGILQLNPSLLPYAHLWCPPTYEFKGQMAIGFYAPYLQKYGGDKIAMDDLDEEPKIPEQMTVQHGYSQGYFEFLTELSTKFGNIFNAKYADINFAEVISDNKILYCLLPEMKMAPSTAKSLGLLVIDAMKKGISKSLGSDAESKISDGFISTLKATSNPTHLFICDEFGSYITVAIEAILAQARSVGIGVVIAAQDIASLNKDESKEILKERIVANCVTKVFLKITDNVSANQAIELIGKEKIIRNKSYDLDEENDLKATRTLQEEEIDFTNSQELGSFKSGFGIVIIDGAPRKFLSSYYEPEPVDIIFNILAP